MRAPYGGSVRLASHLPGYVGGTPRVPHGNTLRSMLNAVQAGREPAPPSISRIQR